MACEKCGSKEKTTEHLVKEGTSSALKSYCEKCAPADPTSVPPISPATPTKSAADAFMKAGGTAPLAQSPQEADAQLAKTFEAKPPAPIPVSEPPATVPLADAPVETIAPEAPKAVDGTLIQEKLLGYKRDVIALKQAIDKAEAETGIPRLRAILQAKLAAIAAIEDLQK